MLGIFEKPISRIVLNLGKTKKSQKKNIREGNLTQMSSSIPVMNIATKNEEIIPLTIAIKKLNTWE